MSNILLTNILKCKSDNTFYHITSTKHISIYDILILWKFSQSTCFHTGYRLVGEKNEIIQTVKNLIPKPVDQKLLDQISHTIVTKFNYMTTHLKLFELEVVTYENMLRSIAQKNTFTQKNALTQKNTFAQGSSSVKMTEDNIDVFDREKFIADYKLFEKYFSGMELYVRIYCWILYKYIRLGDKEDILELENDLLYDKGLPRKNTKEWLENLTDMFEPEHFIYSWYKHFKPSVLYNVHHLAVKYKNHYNHFFNMLYDRYVDKDHKWEDLPFF